MITSIITQPETQLGNEFAKLLSANRLYSKIIFVSAFAALKTILRLREDVLAARDKGAKIRFIVGIDLGGTSREVLEELLRWDCDVFVFHNPIPRSTFHPKIYLFESNTDSTLFLGSNNLTDGGLYTNYEATVRYSFDLPADAGNYEVLLKPLEKFFDPTGSCVCRLDSSLIEILSIRGTLPNEIDIRRNRRSSLKKTQIDSAGAPSNPFRSAPIPMPPLLSKDLRDTPLPTESNKEKIQPIQVGSFPKGVLVWRKILPKTDALQVSSGSHHVGGVRLTQAGFENPPGQRIDQTTYFRRLFDEYEWEPEKGIHKDQEHTFVPMRIVIREQDHSIQNFEISHKPSGEAGQANYTTILRWGRIFNNVIAQENLTNAIFSLYEAPDSDVPFFIEITDT